MTYYVFKRVLAVAPILLGVSVTVFCLMALTPGDTAASLLGPEATDDQIAQLQRSLGLDRPWYVQYGSWLVRTLHGDLGTSITHGQSVLEMLLEGMGNTMLLAAAAVLISGVAGITLGVLSARRPGSHTDRVVMLAVLFVNSMPGFWLGLMLILFFGVRLGVLPTGGMSDLRGDGGPLDIASHLVLPAVTLATFSIATITRTTRASLLESLSQDYIRTARSKGLAERTVVNRHGLRNALLPVVTVVGLQTGNLLGGAVLTETVFAWPGLGLLMQQAISSRDLPVIQGGVLLAAVVFVAVNLLVDLLYAALDPRVSYR